MNEDDLGNITYSKEVEALQPYLRKLGKQAVIPEMVQFLRKSYGYKYKFVGKIQYGEMVADAKTILIHLGIIRKKDDR